MLDPWTALSLASAVVQFVDFGRKVFSTIAGNSRIIVNGLSRADIELLARDLAEVGQKLKHPLTSAEALTGHDASSEANLVALVHECDLVAVDLVKLLKNLQRQHEREGKWTEPWKSFGHAVKTVWKDDQIKATLEKMERFRSQIVVHLVVLLNEKAHSQAEKQQENFLKLKLGQEEVVEILSVHQDWVRDQSSHLARLLKQNERSARERHTETIAAVLTLRDGQTRFISRDPKGKVQLDRDHDSPYQRTLMTIRSHPDGSNAPVAKIEDFSITENNILDCLHFRQIDHREDDIVDAYKNTLRWVFASRSAAPERPWDNLIDWLENGRGCYWINGKAGSGKSTLLKYVSKQAQTEEALRLWAGERELFVGTFFFWNLGTQLQKSQAGLLRSMLYQILDLHRPLIPSIFPDLCRESSKLEKCETLAPPTLTELSMALRRLVDLHSTQFCICFLIDGIDEYEGDHMEISEIFKSLASMSWVKFVLSSRPIPPCVDAFSACPKLRLQDLTHNDIRVYVEDKLNNNRHMKLLEVREGPQALELIDELVERASGVFLWVVLAVRSLLSGLQNHDRVIDLRQRLEELPPDLARLYAHMIRKMPPIYRHQAAQLFSLVLKAAELEFGDLTALQLSYAENGMTKNLVNRQFPVISRDEEVLRVDEIEGRIRSRCCGLLEILGPQTRSKQKKGSFSTVTFLHRTVAEFLRGDEISKDILSASQGKECFDVEYELIVSSLMMIKISRRERVMDLDTNPVWQCLNIMLGCCQLVEDDTGLVKHLDDLDAAMKHHWDAQTCVTQSCRYVEENVWTCDWTEFCLQIAEKESKETAPATARKGIDQGHWRDYYLGSTRDDLKRNSSGTRGMLALAIALGLDYYIIYDILEFCGDPNITCYEKDREFAESPWQRLLQAAATRRTDDNDFDNADGYSQTLARLIVIFVQAGADVNARIIKKEKRFRSDKCALEVVEAFLGVRSPNLVWLRPPPVRKKQVRSAALEEYRARLIGLMIEKGAKVSGDQTAPALLSPGNASHLSRVKMVE